MICSSNKIQSIYHPFRNALTKVLGDIIDKRHDRNVCKINCEENGKIFNQTPFQCHYVSNGQNYNNLLKHQEINDSDIINDVEVPSKSTEDKIVEYQLQFGKLEDFKADVKDGVRSIQDLDVLKTHLVNL